MWPFAKKKKPWQEKQEQVSREIEAATADAEFVVESGPGYRLGRYVRDGKNAVDAYVKAQTIGNRVKLNNVFVASEGISSIADHARKNIGEVRSILCHGTRNGQELEKFQRRFEDAEILGTEIADTAKMFDNTIQWDFHEMKDEWRGKWDVVYSNSWDHAADPLRAFAAWADSLAPGGIMYLEHTKAHEETDKLDMFGATTEALTRFVLEGSKKSVVPMPPIHFKAGREKRVMLPFRRQVS